MSSLKTRIMEMCRNSALVNTAAQFIYLNILRSSSWWGRHTSSREPVRYPADGEVHPVRTAFICDEMTWIDLASQCESIYLWPDSWQEQMKAFQPEIFFCEAAWSGIPPMDGCWRGRIYRNRAVLFENRRILLDILRYCRQHRIPTVFWNKEDPDIGAGTRYDFVDTAIRFDHVFTTAEECVPIYQNLGCSNVSVLPFMVNTAMYYPDEHRSKAKDRVLFAGSWYEDFPRRCQDMTELFDYVLENGYQLDIYDRHSETGESRFRFPERYAPYLHPAVPTDRVSDLMRRYEWAINVNTVTDSRTMFSRRVLYLAACGVRIFSNPSLGLEKTLGAERVELGDNSFALRIEPDAEVVQACYSANRAFQTILDVLKEEALLITERDYVV